MHVEGRELGDWAPTVSSGMLYDKFSQYDLKSY